MRRLTLIRPARLDAVVRSDRDIEFLLRVAVEVADQQTDAAVFVPVPPFVRAGDTGAFLTNRVGQRKLARRLSLALLSGVKENARGDGKHHHARDERGATSFHSSPIAAAARRRSWSWASAQRDGPLRP